MSRISNAHNVSISSSQLGIAAAALSSNQWGSISIPTMTSALITRGDSDAITSYARPAYWHAATKRIYFYGSTHGSSRLKRMIRYIDSTNVWEVDSDGQPETDGQDSHGYYHFTIDVSTGRQYIRHYGAATVSTRLPGGAWSAVQPLAGTLFFDWNVNQAMHWHPGLNSGAGGLVFAGDRTVYTSNAAVTSWTSRLSQAGLNGAGNAIAYCPLDGCVYFGGGTGSLNMWRVDSSGTVTQRANFPVSVGSSTAEGFGGFYRNTSGKVFCVATANNAVYEYDQVANSWSSAITTLPFSPSQNLYFAAPIDDYGVVAFVWLTSATTPSSTMYIWKR